MDWSRYAVGGAAARPDSFTGLRPEFAGRVYELVQAAHAAGIPLQITSAYRSPEVQAQLYERALQRYGSPEAARKWVAPPGRSQHNHGTAVDFALNGSLIRDGNSEAAAWLRKYAPQYGLAVPMEWEPWQVELAGARGQPQPPAQPHRNALAAGVPAEATGRPQNALAGYVAPPQRQNTLMDVRAFQSPQNALSNPFAEALYG